MATVYASNTAWDYTGTESEANASYIWAFFKAKGWTDIAVAGLVGNTTYESYNNPGYHERGGGGFGIVQWTPSGNYINWARPRGFPVDTDYSDPEKYLVGQCERIMYELNTGIEWYGSSRYGQNFLAYNTWSKYTSDTSMTPEQAAYCFLSCYERPLYSAAMASLSARQTYARRWYDLFKSGSTTQQIKVAHLAADWIIKIANDEIAYNGYASHGYDQAQRWGERGDFDCSSLVITAYDENSSLGLKSAGATYTGNMRSVMISKGFEDVTSQINLSTGSGLIEGDVLLNTVHHAAMYVGDGQIVQASINENGGTIGGKQGDQTGNEIVKKAYYNFPWNYVLRYDGYTEGFGQSGASTGVSIVKAVPVTTYDWRKEPYRNG